MKKVISVLMVLGFVWMVVVPGFAGQEKEKEFKSMLDNVKDPKEGRWMLMESYDMIAIIPIWIARDLSKYAENGKLAQWFWEGHFIEEELIQFVSDINEAINHLRTAAKLLNLKGADERLPTTIWQSQKENKLYQGTMEDIRKAEEYIFKAEKIIMRMIKEKPPVIYTLIQKDKPKTREVSRIIIK